MFTGIITDTGTIETAHAQPILRIAVRCAFDMASVTIGESIACNGVCLTVVEKGEHTFAAELSEETIARTAPHQWEAGRRLNLERALRMGDMLGGHMVTGHVDGIARLVSVQPEGASHVLCLEAPAALVRFIAEKGSVTLDGVSLTVNKVEGVRFWVNIIPHTWQNTTISQRNSGDGLNLEVDMVARYLDRLLQKTP